MRLSVIVPIYNERSTIHAVLDRLSELPLEMEILVVDDGSTDGSLQYLEQRVNSETGPCRLKLLVHAGNRGKGAAIRTGLQHAGGDVVIIQDADLEYSPHEIPALLKPIAEGRAEVVFGSRFLGSTRGMNWPNWLANRILTFTTNLLFGAHLTDEATGYKVFRRSVLDRIHLRCRRFEFCPEITAQVLKLGINIQEVPLFSYEARHLDKKISWRDGVVAMWVLVRERVRR